MRYWVRRRSWISCGSSSPYSPSKASRTQSSQFPRTAAVIGIASSNSKRSSLPGPGSKISPKSQYSVAPRARASAITASRAVVSPWISDKIAIRWFIINSLWLVWFRILRHFHQGTCFFLLSLMELGLHCLRYCSWDADCDNLIHSSFFDLGQWLEVFHQ